MSCLLEQLDWRELVWGRLDLQRSDDERQVLDLIERWNVPENVYERLLDATVELRTSAEFDRLKRHALVALAWQPVVHGGLLEELAA
jgi:hypothetical protein